MGKEYIIANEIMAEMVENTDEYKRYREVLNASRYSRSRAVEVEQPLEEREEYELDER